jgi:hypothetical protein
MACNGSIIGSFVVLIGIPAGYVILARLAWKSYDYFNQTLLETLSQTGFHYHLKKASWSFIFIPVAGLLISSIFIGTITENPTEECASPPSSQHPRSTVLPTREYNSSSPPPPANKITTLENSTRKEAALSGQFRDQAVQSKRPEETKRIDSLDENEGGDRAFAKKETEAMEAKAQYSGDDPVVRTRLGLPPKIKD